MFKPNVGGIDWILRAGFGVTAIYIAFIDNEILTDPFSRWALGIFGLIFFVTSIFRFCPLYRLIGFNTSKTGSD